MAAWGTFATTPSERNAPDAEVTRAMRQRQTDAMDFRKDYLRFGGPTSLLYRRDALVLKTHVRRALGEIVLDRPNWWQDHPVQRHEWLDTIAKRVLEIEFYEDMARLVVRMTPMATSTVRRVDGSSPVLSDLLAERPDGFEWLHASYEGMVSSSSYAPPQQQFTDRLDRYLSIAWVFLQQLCVKNEEPWPSHWGVASCVCRSLSYLVEVAARRCTAFVFKERRRAWVSGQSELQETSLKHIVGDVFVPDWVFPMVTTHVNGIFMDLDQVESVVTSCLEDLIADQAALLHGPVPNVAIVEDVAMESPVWTKVSACQTMNNASIDAEGNVTESSPASVNITAVNTLLTSVLPALEHSIQNPELPGKWDECPRLSGNEGSFLVSPVKKTFPVISLRGKQMRMVIRRETIRLAPHASRTPTSWLCEWTKNATQPLYATALVVCGLDNILSPGVRFRNRPYGYTQRRPYKISTFWEDPAAAIYRNDGDPYAPVTAHLGRAIVFPVELQYRIDSLKLIDPARAGALTLLVVGMVDDPTEDLGPDRPLVPSFKTESPEFYQSASRIVGLSVSSYESERWEHYKTHLEPAQLQVLARPHQLPKPVSVSRNPVPTPVLTRLMNETVARVIDQPQWWDSHWEDKSKRREWLRQLLLLQAQQYTGQVVKRLLDDLKISIPNRIPEHGTVSNEGFWRQMAKSLRRMVVSSRLAHESPVQEESDPIETFVTLLMSHLFDQQAAIDPHVAMSRSIMKLLWQNVAHEAQSKLIDALTRVFLASDEDSIESTEFQTYLGLARLSEATSQEIVTAVSAIKQHTAKWEQGLKDYIQHTLVDMIQVSPNSGPASLITCGGVMETWTSDGVFDREHLAALKATEDHDASVILSGSLGHRYLVDPYLFAVLARRTRRLPLFSVFRASSTSEMMATFENSLGLRADLVAMQSMRWLPTNVRIRIDGGVEFLSYINNLHPVKYQATYQSIALGFRAMVPLFERVTRGLRGPKPISYIPSLFDLSKPTGNLPLPAIVSLRGSVVQAVFALHEWCWDSMADEPVGTSEWGGTDDAVLAVGHMVVQTENISTARLAFCQNRQSTVTSFGGRPEPQWEDAGSIACLDNRCIVYPGYYQHQIKLTERVDATKPSLIRLLTIYLLDPKKPVVSTSEVPPQRLDWIQEAILQPISRSRGLPVDLERRIMEMLGVGMSVDEARRHRATMRV